jgi:hypothetical protein
MLLDLVQNVMVLHRDDDDVNCYVSIRKFPELVYVLNILPAFVYYEEIKTC